MPECPTCEEHVSPRFVRVFGNNEGVIPGCTECISGRELRREPPAAIGARILVPETEYSHTTASPVDAE